MIKINLIPPEFAEIQARKEVKFVLGTVGFVVIIIMVIFWAAKDLQATRLESKINTAEATLRQYQAIVDQINEIEGKKQKLASKRDVILNLNQTRLFFPVFFEDLLPLIPSDVWITDIKLDRGTGPSSDYKLSSKALSNFAVATWLTNLEQSTNFSNVKLDRISYDYATAEKDTQATLSFQLGFSYKHQGPMPLTETK